MKRILLVFCFLFSYVAFANLRLNIEFVSKKGIDEGLILVNELHSSEEIFGLRPAILKMKDNLRAEVYAHLVPDYGIVGPSSLVWVYCKIFNQAGILLKDYKDEPLLIPFGKSKKFILKRGELGQSVEVIIKPEFF